MTNSLDYIFIPQLLLSSALYAAPTNLSAEGMTTGVKFSSIRLLVIACAHLVPIVSGWLGATATKAVYTFED